jgi:uncharacterized protein (TIGR02391 family)
MILTDNELREVRRMIEAQAGLDEELLRRCGHLIHLEAFDEAVRSAFVLLEERLRDAVKVEGMTGTQLANHAFSPANGPLAKHLGRNQSEREGLRELYSGAFRLFRNPTAHGVVGYSAAEGKAIIGLVDLLLKLVKRTEDLPPEGLFPENIETVLSKIQQEIGPGATSRLRLFLGKCISEVGLKPSPTATQWLPFRKHALYHADGWEAPKAHTIPVFYLQVESSKKMRLYLPTSSYYAKVVEFNVDRLVEESTALGFQLLGKDPEPHADLRIHNDQGFFDAFLDLVTWTTRQLEMTLQQQ